jgi:iron complex outermembrane receptor protein
VSISFSSFSQEPVDSSSILSEVRVQAFGQYKTNRQSTIAVTTISLPRYRYFNNTTLVGTLNTVAGVRMEERSPGSYRINIRGSSLRSPFGVRNIKVYWNDIPVTDPGGNTYFNMFSNNDFSTLEVFKGPAGSMYGAGTGGLILLSHNTERWQPGVSLELSGGSYNQKNISAQAKFGTAERHNTVSYAHNESDGYRVQTKMRRDNFSWTSTVTRERYELTGSLLFSNLYYQTPGALTLAEYTANPKAARPAGGGFPSAVNAKAAIAQKNVIAGFSGKYKICDDFSNTTTFYGMYAQVKNSAIRNYERRNEPSFGGRTVFNLNKSTKEFNWGWIAGAEFQQGYFNTLVSKNRNGNPDTLQTNDDVDNTTYNIFTQGSIEFKHDWSVVAGASLTKSKISIRRLSTYPVKKQERSYRNELSPRISLMKKFARNFSLRATVSRGFSPPTTAEVLPSTGVITTNLEAEQGWNYETSVGAALWKHKINIDVTAFYFKLHNALVQRRDISGADFFVNAGDIKQKGLELHGDMNTDLRSRILTKLNIRADVALYDFHYGSFVKGTDNFSGKEVPSVPATSYSLLADLQFAKGFYLTGSYYNSSKIFLNDANTASADAYHLLGAQVGWKMSCHSFIIGLNMGADNLLDEKYSLGNDINAAGGRYYNAAPGRNYYAGITVNFRAKN